MVLCTLSILGKKDYVFYWKMTKGQPWGGGSLALSNPESKVEWDTTLHFDSFKSDFRLEFLRLRATSNSSDKPCKDYQAHILACEELIHEMIA